MSVRKRLMLGLGGLYELLFRIPLIGEPLVRGITRGLGFLIYHTPQGPRPCETMAEFRQDFARMTTMMDFDLETFQHGEDRLEIILETCPYGYRRPDQQGVCDAAMDMDRAMFGHAGYEVTIDACIPCGAPVCLVSIHKKP